MQAIVIAILGSGAFSALISGIITLITARQKEKKGSDELILFLTAAMLYNLAEQALSKKSITMRGLELFNDMYDKYKAKGGNGYVDILKMKVNALPVVTDKAS